MAYGDRPVVGAVYDENSISPLRLSAAWADRLAIVWIVDDDYPPSSTAMRLLRRFGSVVDIYGLDVASAADRLREQQIDGLVSFADRQLQRAAAIASELGLRFHRPEVAARLTVKSLQRAALAKAGVPVPRFRSIPAVSGPAKLAELVTDLQFPLVYKPESGGGSRETFLADDVHELLEFADLVAQHEPQDMIVEEFLLGRDDAGDDLIADYVSVENIVCDGEVTAVAMSGRLRPAEPFRETGAFVPATVSADDYQIILDTARDAAHALEVEVGCLHTEIKLTPDGPRVIEVNGRVGGGGMPDTLKLTTGASILLMTGLAAVGVAPDFIGPLPTDGVAYFFALQPPVTARRLERLERTKDLLALPGVVTVERNARVGDAIDTNAGSYGYLLSMLGKAANHAEVCAMYRTMLDTVDVAYS